ncbi:MAG: beta-N-acetylhexosaminidase [Peptococcaceae bacterium]|nr:beta-N-acetylhexosaminidase [Peptococcaceae bacterium]
MPKRNIILLFIIGLIFLLGGCALLSGQNGSNQQLEEEDQESQLNDYVRTQINAMSIEEKIGQLVIAGVDGYENDLQAQTLIEEYKIGGIILFERNIKDLNQMLELINSLKESNSVNPIPLFLAIDEEGGRVSRLPDEFLKTPASQKVGEINDSELSVRLASIVGEQLKACGLNMNFAPVLDVNSNPNNPVIGDRSFSHDPDQVCTQGIQTMNGLRSQDIISVVKHFPGHGDTLVDSHLGLPVVDHDINRLYSLELIPFACAIENKAEAIMTAHILLPNIDPHNPASFSSNTISKILRQDLGFDGLVITDDLTMAAVIDNYDIQEAAVQAIKAGSDQVLVCHDFQKEKAVLQALKQAVESGDISVERLEQSLYRILKLKMEYNLTDEPVSTVNYQALNQKLEALYKDYQDLSYLLKP